MTGQLTLSSALLRTHRAGYLAFAAVLVCAGVLSAAELVLFLALGTGAGISWEDYSLVEQAVMRNTLEGSSGLFQFMGVITIMISLILIFFGFRNMMASRQRELGQMRMLGASPLQLRKVIALEASIFSAVILIPSVLVGWLCAAPLFAGLRRLGVFTDAITLDMGFPVAALVGLILLLVVCTVLAAWLSVRPRDTRNVLEAAQFTPASDTQRRMGTQRLVWGSVSVVVLLVFLVFMPQGEDANAFFSLILPVLIVLPLATLAPVLIPPIARLCAYVLAPVAGGPAVLVAQRAARDARRFSASVLPILILMGVMAGFAIGGSPDNARLREQVATEFTAPYVLQSENPASLTEAAELVQGELGAGSATRFTSTTLLLDTDQPRGPLTLFNFTDVHDLSRVVTLDVLAGDAEGLGPGEAISTREGDSVGDTVTISNGEGATTSLSVAAIIEDDMFFTGLVLDWSLLEVLQPATWNSGVLLSDPAARLIRAAPPADSTMVSQAEYAQQQVDARDSGALAGNFALFGTTYAIAVIALLQGLAASTLKRREEFSALRQLGASRAQVIVQVLVEAIVLTLSTAFLLAAACGVMIWRFFAGRSETLWQLFLQVPWGQIGTTYLVVAGVFVATAVLAGLAATRLPRSAARFRPVPRPLARATA